MTEETRSLKEKVEKVAHKLADDMLSDKPPSDQYLAVFSALCKYLIADHKLNPPGDDDGKGDTFGGFRDSIANAK